MCDIVKDHDLIRIDALARVDHTEVKYRIKCSSCEHLWWESQTTEKEGGGPLA
jgi:hypothetical protein